MPYTVFTDVILRDTLVRAGVGGRSSRKNDRSENQAGYGQAVIKRDRTLREWNFGTVPLLQEIWDTIEGLYEITAAGAYGFLIHDPKDYVCGFGVLAGVNSGLTIGDAGTGWGLPSYRMFQRKKVTGSTRTYDRRVTRPESPSSITRNGAPLTVGVGAGNIAINYDTGTVTFVADATQSVSSVTAGTTTQVTLNAALPTMVVGGRLYLSGLTGADAALLNGQSHSITAITGGGLNVYTLATNTAGKTITVGAGQGAKYPQPADVLRWTGNFYVPVHFRDDYIDWNLVRGGIYDDRLVAGPSVTLVEILEP